MTRSFYILLSTGALLMFLGHSFLGWDPLAVSGCGSGCASSSGSSSGGGGGFIFYGGSGRYGGSGGGK